MVGSRRKKPVDVFGPRQALLSGAAPEASQDLMTGNRKEPWCEAAACLIELGSAAPKVKERLLHDIVSLARTEQVCGHHVDGPVIAIVER
jgi:hypothetical protein